ncbi:4-hydroxyphenylacetate 3-hydroxylase family protein [Cohnella thailandensis]|uniref:4-hydroxyphenylacetate 3-hydroxylase n=1 Tax=Cohnella thailandensis TaxID=557557 RepID=A0A841SUB2_9BACL|nr:4-hydroxyphenylacetate 3-hydroxylase N-terminal domain-containing protein [Cohnella thailandensis]MBB6633480.1 4-hydroxyphenylacetate 3-hydroxylase [Cohnella thailandensis]MBP1974497.1 4-hydroxyphenylacetate 3-monooxygenase [Cohnella thailandensis]
MALRGKKFLDSLSDGRSVWIDDERVENLPEHPAFSGTLGTIGGLFDLLDDPKRRDEVGFAVPGREAYAHSSFLVPYSAEDLAKRTRAFDYWAQETNGVMSRLSDYARSLVTGWYGARKQLSQLDPGIESKLAAYYEQARDNDLFLTTSLLDPQIDRSKGLDDKRIAERFLHVVRENKEGIYVSGAKMIATGAPYTHDFIVFSFYRLESQYGKHAHALLVPANSKGLHIVCRESFAEEKTSDHPLSSRYDEMDAVLLFDEVFIPWERVLLYGDAEAVWKLRSHQSSNSLAFHQTVVRFVAKLEFLAGVAFAIAESIGVNGFLHVQEKLGELITQIDTMKALLIASEAKAHADPATGIWVPEASFIDTARSLGTKLYPRAIEILQQVGGGGFIQTPSSLGQFGGPIGELLHRYFEGVALNAESKIQLFKLAWDLIGSPLGSRHELYERFYAGDPVRGLANQYLNADKTPWTERVWKLLEKSRA